MGMQYLPIDTAVTTNALVAAVAGQKIRVLGYFLVAAGSVTAQWLGGSTELTGPMSMIVGVPLNPTPPATQPPPGGQRPALFEAAPGVALNLTLGGTVQVSGHLEYERVPV